MAIREVIFRGKRADSGEWIEGDVLQTRYHSGHIEYQIMPQTPVSSAYPVLPETVGQYTGLTDRNGKKIFEGDRIIYRHQCKKLIPCDDATQEEKLRYGIDNDSGLGLAYRPTRTIRYKGYVTIDNLCGLDLNLGNRCQWWRCKKGEQLMAVEVIGNIHDNPELME